ncbi:MAG: hypothetical protein LAP39_23590 [Acidobacteriia bacterium]|nr:hypothetical protein [Terriglobia bacterium]
MRTFNLLLAVALVGPGLAAAQDIAGEWHGSIEIEDDAPLRLALHIVRTGSGGIRATVDSMDEGGMDLPVDSIAVESSTMKFEMTAIGGTYQGKIAADGSRIVGSWSQDHAIWPLTWLRGEDPGNTWKLFDEQQTLENGRTYTRWFYEGKIPELWEKLSPVMHQALGTEANFHELRGQVLQQMGVESKVSDESVKPEGALRVYRRLAKFDKAGSAIEVTLAFDSRGAVAQFNVRLL